MKLQSLTPHAGPVQFCMRLSTTFDDVDYRCAVKVVGYDEFIYAVEMTKFMLSAFKYDRPEFRIADVQVKCRDLLSDEPWPSANIILMNSPFVSLRNLNPHQKQLVSKTLGNFARGRPDLSMAFVERALEALAPTGVSGTLLPAGVLSMTYAQDRRRHLLNEASVAFLAVFGELGLFQACYRRDGLRGYAQVSGLTVGIPSDHSGWGKGKKRYSRRIA